MIACLNQSESLSTWGSTLMSGATFTVRPSRDAAKQQGGVAVLIDTQPDAAPFERVPLAGDQVLDRFDAMPVIRRADLELAEMKPELSWSSFCQCHRHGDRILALHRFLDKSDYFAVVDLREAQVAGLQQSRVSFPYPIKLTDVILDIAGLLPVPDLKLVFLRVEIFLLAGYRFMLEQLESIVDAVAARERSRQRDARLEHPRLSGL